MEIFVFIISTTVFLYSLMILSFIAGFYRIPEETYQTKSPVNSFSIIVPFRNEEENIEMLIDSINRIEYPINKFEVIFVNDNSDDFSLEIANKVLEFTSFNYTVISQHKGVNGKKTALTLGIKNAIYPWIITTDADCTVQPLWLKLYDQKLEEKEVIMLAGPVNYYSSGKGFIDTFQKLDLAGLMGTTIGSFGIEQPIMCNGANLLFSKEAFNEVSGYEGNMHISSGDDMFIMEKFKNKYPGKLRYLKANYATVYTSSIVEINAFINQRVRWSSKSTQYGSKFIKLIATFVGLANISITILFFLALFGVCLDQILPIIGLKLFMNFWLIKITSNFLNDHKQLLYYPIIAIIYPFYVIAITIVAQFYTFEWKGRRYNK